MDALQFLADWYRGRAVKVADDLHPEEARLVGAVAGRILTPDAGGPVDVIIALDALQRQTDLRSALNDVSAALHPEGCWCTSARLNRYSPGLNAVAGFDSVLNLLRYYFEDVSFFHRHGQTFSTDWNRYSEEVLFVGRRPTGARLPADVPMQELLEDRFSGRSAGYLPKSADAAAQAAITPHVSVAKGRMLFFVQPLPLYDDPMVYQRFFEQYLRRGRGFAQSGWDPWYVSSDAIKRRYDIRQTIAPKPGATSPGGPGWKEVYRSILSREPDLSSEAVRDYRTFVEQALDEVKPDVVFLWNHNRILDRAAAERNILVVHEEVGLERFPTNAAYFYDPIGINQNSSLPGLIRGPWQTPRIDAEMIAALDAYLHASTPVGAGELGRTRLRAELFEEPRRPIVLLVLQVEADSNILCGSPFASMSDYIEKCLAVIDTDRFNVLIKEHPADPERQDLSRLTWPAGVRVAPSRHAMHDLIETSDIVVTINSTAGLEALRIGKEVVTFGPAPYTGLGVTLEGMAGLVEAMDGFPRRRSDAETNEIRSLLYWTYFVYQRYEPFFSSAARQEPVIERWLALHRRRSPIEAYWDDADHSAQGVWRKAAELIESRVQVFERHASSQAADRAWLETQARRAEDRSAAAAELHASGLATRKKLLAAEGAIDRLGAELESARAAAKELGGHLEFKTRQLARVEGFAATINDELSAIYRTRGHRWLNRLRVFRDDFLRGGWADRKRYLHRVAAKARLCAPLQESRVVEPDPGHAFSAFKRRLQSGLPVDLRAVRCDCVPGLVSVVLPVYNHADMVAASIDSVLAQTYRKLELIVVDDGSTDGLEKVLAPYRDPRLRVVHQENQRLPAALSNGFAHARGEFFTWTSADNLMLPDVLAGHVGFLRDQPTVQMVYGNYQIIDDNGRPYRDVADWCPDYQTPPGSGAIHLPRDINEFNCYPNNYVGPSFLYRGWVGRLLGGYLKNGHSVEDYDYWMRINAFFKLRHAGRDDCRYLYRLHDRSLTANMRELRIRERTLKLMEIERWRQAFYLQPFRAAVWAPHSARTGARIVELLAAAGHAAKLTDTPKAARTPVPPDEKRLVILIPPFDDGPPRLQAPGVALCLMAVGRPRIEWLGGVDCCFATNLPRPPSTHRGVFAVPDMDRALYPALCAANNKLANDLLADDWERFHT